MVGGSLGFRLWWSLAGGTPAPRQGVRSHPAFHSPSRGKVRQGGSAESGKCSFLPSTGKSSQCVVLFDSPSGLQLFGNFGQLATLHAGQAVAPITGAAAGVGVGKDDDFFAAYVVGDDVAEDGHGAEADAGHRRRGGRRCGRRRGGGSHRKERGPRSHPRLLAGGGRFRVPIPGKGGHGTPQRMLRKANPRGGAEWSGLASLESWGVCVLDSDGVHYSMFAFASPSQSAKESRAGCPRSDRGAVSF